MCSLESRGRILTENKSMADLAQAHTNQDLPAVLSKILDTGRLAAIFPGLEHAGLTCLVRLADESPGDASH
jgi:hypothetical protein